MSFGPALARFIRAVVGPVDYFAQYPAKVLAQNGDGTLELQPDSARVPALSAVPMRGLPGVVAKVKPGARVLVGFENGSPDAPVALLAESSGLLQLTITADVKVTVSAPLVELGGASPGDALALASKTNARLSALETAFNSHVHATAALGTPSPPLPVPGTIPVGATPGSPLVGSVASGTVKAKP